MKFRIKKRWKIFISIISLIVIVLLISWPRAPEVPDTVNDLEELETYMENLVEFGTPPGISLVVVKGDRIVYGKGFGWADKPKGIKATPKTIYHWWSIRKIATAVAILQLQEQGKLNVNDPVANYLDFFKPVKQETSHKEVTIMHLLNHSSGIPDAGFKIMNWIHHEGTPPLNQTEMIKEVFPDYSNLEFEPGSQASYTNIGYMVLGAIIEKVTGESYENYIRTNILYPLGMAGTDFVYHDKMVTEEASGTHPLYDIYTPIFPFIKASSYIRETHHNQIWLERIYTDQTPPSGLIGSALDAALFVQAYLNKGMLDSARILPEEYVHKMTHENYMKLADNPADYFVRHGIGWQIYKNNDAGLILEHTGGGIGFSTIMQIQPERDIGFILFANSTNCEGWRIIQLASGLDW